jgi:hypothetical protein
MNHGAPGAASLGGNTISDAVLESELVDEDLEIDREPII